MISAGLRNMMARNIAVVQNGMFAAQAAPLRAFAKKGKKAKADGAATVTEDEDAAVERETVPEPVKAAPVRAASSSWSCGDIPQIHSVADNICPV